MDPTQMSPFFNYEADDGSIHQVTGLCTEAKSSSVNLMSLMTQNHEDVILEFDHVLLKVETCTGHCSWQYKVETITHA
jgi:hypothetical protein